MTKAKLNRATARESIETPTPAVAPPPAPPEPSLAGSGKIDLIIARMRRPEGASIEDLVSATGWQAHSVRGAVAGTIKKKRGLTVVSARTDAGRTYRIVGDGEAK